MTADYKFNGAVMIRMSEAGFSMMMPFALSGEMQIGDTLDIPSRHVKRISGKIILGSWATHTEPRPFVGALEYRSGDVSEGPKGITLMESPDVSNRSILILPMRTRKPQEYELGYTVEIPESAREMHFYSGRTFKPEHLIKPYNENVAKQMASNEGLTKLLQALGQKIDRHMNEQKVIWSEGNDRLKTNLDIVLFN